MAPHSTVCMPDGATSACTGDQLPHDQKHMLAVHAQRARWPCTLGVQRVPSVTLLNTFPASSKRAAVVFFMIILTRCQGATSPSRRPDLGAFGGGAQVILAFNSTPCVYALKQC